MSLSSELYIFILFNCFGLFLNTETDLYVHSHIQLLFTQNVYLFSLTRTVYVYSHVQLSSSSMLLQSFSPLQI